MYPTIVSKVSMRDIIKHSGIDQCTDKGGRPEKHQHAANYLHPSKEDLIPQGNTDMLPIDLIGIVFSKVSNKIRQRWIWHLHRIYFQESKRNQTHCYPVPDHH